MLFPVPVLCFSCVFFFFFSLYFHACHSCPTDVNFNYPIIVAEDISELAEELFDTFRVDGESMNQQNELIGSTVRLSFHDCGGATENDATLEHSICDGCVDLALDDHVGLAPFAIEVLEDIFANSSNAGAQVPWCEMMSRADFWATASVLALKFAAHSSSATVDGLMDLTSPAIPYYFGRKQCSTSPNENGVTFTQPKAFPRAIDNWPLMETWFTDNLGLDAQEVVALMGAHTLGGVHQSASAFNGDGVDFSSWVVQTAVLDNQFYIDLLAESPDLSWTAHFNDDAKWMWIRTDAGVDNHQLIMLNVDQAMVHDFTLTNALGLPSCTTSAACSDNSATIAFVQQYAANNTLWLRDFADVFERMIIAGYNQTQDLYVVSHDNLFVDTTVITTTVVDDGGNGGDSPWYYFGYPVMYFHIAVLIIVAIIVLCVCLCICCACRRGRRRRAEAKAQANGSHVQMGAGGGQDGTVWV